MHFNIPGKHVYHQDLAEYGFSWHHLQSQFARLVNVTGSQEIAVVYAFDDFVVDTERYELKHLDKTIGVEPKVFNLIAHLVANPHQVFSVDELIESVWDGRIVSDATVASCVKNARKALRDGSSKAYLETVRGRGFRFNAEISHSGQAQQGSLTESHSILNSIPTIIILPFVCLAEDTGVQLAVSGISNDLGSILSRIPLLNQSVEASRFIGREIQPTARELHEALGVDFVLYGSSQQVGQHVRSNVQLANARTGMRIWAESFDNDLPDPEWSLRCVHAIIGRLEPRLYRAMIDEMSVVHKAASAPLLFLEATDLLIRHGWNHVAVPQAPALLKQSSELDAGFALAPALHSMLLGFGHMLGILGDDETLKSEALRNAELALSIDNLDSTVLGFAGCSLADIGYTERGELLLQNAIDQNGSNAQAWVALGTMRLLAGDVEEAVARLSHGIEISPLDSRLSIWGSLYAIALLRAGSVDEACAAAEAACRRHDNTYPARIVLAGARYYKGDVENARLAIAEARRIKPDLNKLQIERLVGKKLRAGLEKISRQDRA